MENKIETDLDKMGLRDISVGYIRFNIKAEDTKTNSEIHNEFKEYCKKETLNDYTLGLKKLMESANGDYKYKLIHDKIEELFFTLEDLKSSIINNNNEKKVIKETVEEEDDSTF